MLLNLLFSLCCVATTGDTLEVATVSSFRDAAVSAVSPLQSMSRKRIERLGTIGLHEALNLFPGVSVRDYGGTGGLKTVSVRNMGTAHTSVVYDGIAISDAQNGQIDISRFNLDDIASVSLSISLPEDIFCSARHLASSGVLNIESCTPEFEQSPAEINTKITIGSFGTYIPYISFNGRIRDSYMLKASFNGTFSRGNYPFLVQNGQTEILQNRQNSDVASYGGEADFRADWHRSGRLRGKINFNCSERGLPGSVVLYTGNAFERLWDKSVISNLMYDIDLGEKWKFHVDAGFSHSFNRHIDTDPAYLSPQESIYRQNEYSVAARVLWMPVPGWKIALADDMFINTLDSNVPKCPFPVRLSNSAALSAQYSGNRVKMTACLGGLFIREHLKAGNPPADRFRLTPMIGLSWNFHKNLHLRACFKEGFRVPTFNDLYYAKIGNIGLKPEIARQSNLGMTFSTTCDWGAAEISADGYYNSIKDKIAAIPTMFIWKMRNFGRVAMYGTDITASAIWNICRKLSLHIHGSWSLQYAIDITDPESKNYKHQIPYTPRHCGNGSLTIETPWANVSFRVNATGKRYSLNQNIPANEISGYADHSLSINREFKFGEKHQHNIYACIEGLNLTGSNYEIIRYYPMPGRSFRITLKYKY